MCAIKIQSSNFILFTENNSSCDGADITVDVLTRQHAENLKERIAMILNHNNEDSDTARGENRTLLMCRHMLLYH